tara:strand:+ start:2437 stop:3201 length:765 start_codon:yes stop_codon:yes gene_type:complete
MNFEKYIKDFERDSIYYGDKNFITSSQLGKLAHSPAKLEHYRKYGQDDTNALLFGRAFHQNILEPEKYEEQVISYDGTRRGKAWEEFKSENSNKTIITRSEGNNLIKMREKLLSIPRVINLLSGGEAEVVNCWEDGDTGVYCKGKADYVKTENGRTILVDIKTTQDHKENSFKGSCWKYGYDRQSAFYLDGFDADEFWFIVIEKTDPFDIGIYMCGDEFINNGRQKYKDLLNIYDEYFIKQNREIKEYYIETIL